MKIFILLVEERKVGLLRKVIEQVEQGQTRYADALREHIYATLLVEGKQSVDGLQKGNHIPIVVPDEKVSQSRHIVLAPSLLTTGVILVGNTLVLQSTEEGLFRWKSGVVEPLQAIHVLKFTDCNEDLSSCDQAAREDLFRRLARKTLLDIVNLKENLSVSINDQQDFWTFRNSFAFVICATTTIGYGTPSPRTTGGRVFVVILYIVGIPFTILAVLDAGKLFFMLERFVFRNTVYLCKRSFYGCKSFYNKLRPIVKPNRVEDFENPEEITLAPIVSIVKRLSVVSSTQDIVGARPKESVVQLRHRKRVKELRVKERVERLEALTVRQLISTAIRMWVRHKWMSIVGRLRGKSEDLDDTQLDQTAGHRDSDVPPVRVMVLNLVAFVFGGAMLYRHYEGWTYWQSVYYIFTSISTVGFGDLLPKDELFLLLQAFYTVLGLSLLSMFVSSVQEILVESLIQLIIQLEQQQCTRIDDDFTNNAGNYTYVRVLKVPLLGEK
ncbi:hypothetical protein LSAT2_012844 [Lamellibrachia satsuma]|nr:hypothetical protein LSAT2_012844 [Lamellibrachia satsuma]